MAIREYFVIGAIGVLCVFSFAIWLEKMLRIILGNYLLTALCLSLSPTLDRLMWWTATQEASIQNSLWFLFTNKTIVILIVYFFLLILIFAKSRIKIDVNFGGLKKVFYFILVVPMTILSVLFTLEIAILGVDIFSTAALTQTALTMPIPALYQNFLINTPMLISLHAFLTILLLSDIHFSLPRRRISLPDVSMEE